MVGCVWCRLAMVVRLWTALPRFCLRTASCGTFKASTTPTSPGLNREDFQNMLKYFGSDPQIRSSLPSHKSTSPGSSRKNEKIVEIDASLILRGEMIASRHFFAVLGIRIRLDPDFFSESRMICFGSRTGNKKYI